MSKVDLTVLGAGLGGLAAAALLARQKKKVIVYVPGNEVGGAFVPAGKGGYRFSLGPTLSFGYERGGALHKLYTEMGISLGDMVRSSSYQVALPDRRLTVYPEKNETLEELRREYPQDIDRIVRLFHAVDKIAVRSSKSRLTSFFSRRRRSSSLLQRYRFSTELLSFFDIQSRYFFGQTVHDLPINKLVSMMTTSPLYEPQGFKKIADLLLETILQHNGTVLFSEPFPELIVQRGRVGLRVSGGPSGSGTVLLNTSGHHRDTFRFFGIEDQGIPVGMRHEVICLPEYARPDELFSLTVSMHGDGSAAPQGKRAVTVWFPFRGPDDGQTGTLLDPVGGIMPFLDRFSETIAVQRPDDAQYATPPDLFLSKEVSTAVLERGIAKNLYGIRDDANHPVQALAAAERIADFLM